MKKIMIFAAVAAMFSLASCQKDEFVANNEVKDSPVFTAVINSESTKTTVAIDGNKGKISWEQTDEITITDSSTPTPKTAVYKVKSIDETTRKATFEIKSGETALGAGPYTATYGVAQPTYQTYSASAPASAKLYMEAPSTATKEFVFDVKCGLMKLNLSKDGETITDIAVTATPTGGTKKTYTMYCPGGVDISSGKDFFIALPAGSYDKIEVYKHDATNGFMVCSLIPSTSIAISANHIKPVNASDSKIVFSECQNLPGVFSVSNDDGTTIQQIRFSKGNLQATYSTSTSKYTWGFAANQYSCIGEAAGNTTIDSQTDGAVVDLFGWSTASTTYGISTSDSSGDYSGNFKDWGTAIDDKGTWRTLTLEEWCYLFAYDPETYDFIATSPRYNLYKTGVTVCGKANCLVIAPDGWNLTTHPLQSSYGTESSEGNPMTWEQAEAKGLVCLPAAGSRDDSDVDYVGDRGYYWSSTAYDEGDAYDVYFSSGDVGPDDSGARSSGSSVRLITESK